jgi:hypothetical protein
LHRAKSGAVLQAGGVFVRCCGRVSDTWQYDERPDIRFTRRVGSRRRVIKSEEADVATIRKDAISFDEEHSRWRVLVRTQKSGETVYLPIPDDLKMYWTHSLYRGMRRRMADITFGTGRV